MNSRLDTLQATILIEKLRIFNKELSKKKQIFQFYNKNISDNYIKPLSNKKFKSAMALYTLQSNKRDKIMKMLTSRSIPCAVYYSKPLHKQKAYKNYPISSDKCKVSEKLSKKVFSLPLHAYMKKKDMKKIINSLNTPSKI